MAEFPTYEEMAKNIAEKALDEFLYDGKSIREWMQIITSEDCISRQAVLDLIEHYNSDGLGSVFYGYEEGAKFADAVNELPPVTPQQKIGRCKDCKYFEYDSVAKVDGIPLIVAHEICSKWGDGCKTKEDGYCFLFEPQERSEHHNRCKDCVHGDEPWYSMSCDPCCGSNDNFERKEKKDADSN